MGFPVESVCQTSMKICKFFYIVTLSFSLSLFDSFFIYRRSTFSKNQGVYICDCVCVCVCVSIYDAVYLCVYECVGECENMSVCVFGWVRVCVCMDVSG